MTKNNLYALALLGLTVLSAGCGKSDEAAASTSGAKTPTETPAVTGAAAPTAASDSKPQIAKGADGNAP